MNTFHLYNFAEDICISGYTPDPRYVSRECIRTFKVRAYHLKDVNRKFQLHYRSEIALFEQSGLNTDNTFLSFEATAGDSTYSMEDAEISEDKSGSMKTLILEFVKDIEVAGELDITVCSRCLAWSGDNVDVYYVKYPTNGYRVTLNYKNGLEYDAAWYKARTPGPGFQLNKRDIRARDNGIVATTNDWVLPGEGVAISWHQKIRTNADVEQPGASSQGT